MHDDDAFIETAGFDPFEFQLTIPLAFNHDVDDSIYNDQNEPDQREP
jgi:hypothetical protein